MRSQAEDLMLPQAGGAQESPANLSQADHVSYLAEHDTFARLMLAAIAADKLTEDARHTVCPAASPRATRCPADHHQCFFTILIYPRIDASLRNITIEPYPIPTESSY